MSDLRERIERLQAEEGRRDKPATIYDVARRANVSIKTVSHVINRRMHVSEPTRARVQKAIDELSFQPNVFARGLAGERSYLIALLCDIPATGSGYVSALQIGMLPICRSKGFHLMVESFDVHSHEFSEQVRSLVAESRLHGVILTPPLCDMPELIHTLENSRTAFVRIAPERPTKGAIDIHIDDVQAAHEMTSYLIRLGHRRIAFIKGPTDHADANARFNGYRAALAQAGLPFIEELCVQGAFSYQSGLKAGEHLLSLRKRPTAIFAGNDDMAAAVLAIAQRFNVDIPRQLSVAGFDDSPVCQVVWPGLTTCRQPIEEMAQRAISLLITGDDLVNKKLSHELVVRESTAPPDE
ncbi:MAG: LacI family DNA-binding transcriptional regulator [Alphaproteobacteria bacterium]|nr:LacI family DNA-binding transcriptional regulator [Alphaproteobacteria bacterium]